MNRIEGLGFKEAKFELIVPGNEAREGVIVILIQKFFLSE